MDYPSAGGHKWLMIIWLKNIFPTSDLSLKVNQKVHPGHMELDFATICYLPLHFIALFICGKSGWQLRVIETPTNTAWCVYFHILTCSEKTQLKALTDENWIDANRWQVYWLSQLQSWQRHWYQDSYSEADRETYCITSTCAVIHDIAATCRIVSKRDNIS